jgi:hypothetical protein
MNIQRLIGSGRDTGEVIQNINTFRTKEIVDADKNINKQELALARQQLLGWKGEDDTVEPQDTMTEQQQYALTKLFQSFLNELDIQVQNYYGDEDIEHTNSGMLIPKWNQLINYYNSFVSKNFKPYIDNMFNRGDTLKKIDLVDELANDKYYTDVLEVSTLYNNVMKQNYKPIQHLLFSKRGEQQPTRYETQKSANEMTRKLLEDEIKRYEKEQERTRNKEEQAQLQEQIDALEEELNQLLDE